MTPQEHSVLLRAFEVDRLLKLLALEAKKHHDGHYAILAFTTGYKVAFGTLDLASGKGRAPVAAMPSFSTLKEALIAALVTGKTFADYGEEAAPRQARDDLTWGAITFERHGRPYCRGEVAWSHGGTSPIGFMCACGVQFIFAIERPEDHSYQDDPIVQAIMHIHKVHRFPLEMTYEMFKMFPQVGVQLSQQEAAVVGSRLDQDG